MTATTGGEALPTPLFILGLGRSGTTALVETFAAHPRVVLGVERFKRWSQGKASAPSLLDAAHFFDFADEMTNIVPEGDEKWRQHYDRMAEKWQSASYVGDKLTRVRPQRIWRAFPDARIVFAVRDIHAVAHSWQARAQNAEDQGWASHRDAKLSVLRWNDAMSRTIRAAESRPDQVRVVEHTDFFGDRTARRLREVLTWMALDAAPDVMSTFAAVHERYLRDVAPKVRDLAPEDRDFLTATADTESWRRVVELARRTQ